MLPTSGTITVHLGDSSLRVYGLQPFPASQPLSVAPTAWWLIVQHGSCDGTPRYGARGGPLSFCQAHKRVGLFTIRDGELYVATRDGSGESFVAMSACCGEPCRKTRSFSWCFFKMACCVMSGVPWFARSRLRRGLAREMPALRVLESTYSRIVSEGRIHAHEVDA